ncbi:hypothetical protein [Azorhizophilus paspali]|uniref:hypothetical protein n=1 Tax=Azorhizophilus paspali TaxID=69963 RepID=UPI0036716F5D
MQVYLIYHFFIISGLVHEASIFIILPLLLGVWSFLHRSDWCVKYALYVVFVFGVAIVETIYISTKGLDEIIDHSEYYSKLLSIDNHAYFDAVLVLYRSLGDNLSLTFNNTIDFYNVQRHLIMLAGLIPSFIIFKRLYVVTLQAVGIQSFEFVLLMLSLSPLLLYPLGYDQLRWWSMAIANLSISIVIIIIYNTELAEKLMDYFF